MDGCEPKMKLLYVWGEGREIGKGCMGTQEGKLASTHAIMITWRKLKLRL